MRAASVSVEDFGRAVGAAMAKKEEWNCDCLGWRDGYVVRTRRWSRGGARRRQEFLVLDKANHAKTLYRTGRPAELTQWLKDHPSPYSQPWLPDGVLLVEHGGKMYRAKPRAPVSETLRWTQPGGCFWFDGHLYAVLMQNVGDKVVACKLGAPKEEATVQFASGTMVVPVDEATMLRYERGELPTMLAAGTSD